MKRTNRLLRWFLFNGLIMASLWYGYEHDCQGAKNIALFCLWATIVVSPFFLVKECADSLENTFKYIPEWMELIYNGTIIALLVWHGAIVTGAFYFIHMVIITMAYQTYRVKITKPKK